MIDQNMAEELQAQLQQQREQIIRQQQEIDELRSQQVEIATLKAELADLQSWPSGHRSRRVGRQGTVPAERGRDRSHVSRRAWLRMASTGAVAAVGAGILTERDATPALAAGQTADYFDANASASNAFTTIGYGYTFGVNVIGTSIGVKGTCADSTNNPNDEVGVYGVTRGGEGVRAEATGTDSLGNPGTGVTGSSAAGYGGVFTGGRAPILLNPSFSTGAPTTGIHFIGEVYVDGNGVFWVCAADGTPGTWNALSSVVPIPNVRVLNTRPGKQIGPYTGPIANNTVLTLTLAGTNGIPSNATGVMGNLTAADASAGCFLALVPSGANHMGVSSVNFPALPLGSGVANSFTVGLAGTPGTVDIYTGNCSTYTVNIIMDITGYII